jgi:L-iditol 2-dehydrogenase
MTAKSTTAAVQSPPNSMSAAIMTGARQIALGRREKPVPGAGEVLIRVQANSICGSDLHYFHEGQIGGARIDAPFTPGHEFAGLVTEGSGLAFGLEDGTLVAVDPCHPCGQCEQCYEGQHHLCPHHVFLGAPPHHGAMAEYIAVPASSVHRVPNTFSARQAALLEPLGVAMHAVELAKLRPGSDTLVLGAGTIGLYMQMLALQCGALRVCVIEPLEYRRAKAIALGARAAFADVGAYLEFTAGRGADVVLEATTSPDGPNHATQAAAIGGKVVLVGIPDGDEFSLRASVVRRKGLTIKLSRRMGHVYPRAIAYVASGRIDVDAIVTHTMPLAQVTAAFEMLSEYRDEVIKVVLSPSSD